MVLKITHQSFEYAPSGCVYFLSLTRPSAYELRVSAEKGEAGPCRLCYGCGGVESPGHHALKQTRGAFSDADQQTLRGLHRALYRLVEEVVQALW